MGYQYPAIDPCQQIKGTASYAKNNIHQPVFASTFSTHKKALLFGDTSVTNIFSIYNMKNIHQNIDFKGNVTPMLLVAKLANTNNAKILEKTTKPWHMGTHPRAVCEG